MARHSPAIYLSAQDRANLEAGLLTSWQPASSRKRSVALPGSTHKNRKAQTKEVSPEDQRLLAELPPHYHPGNQ